MKAAIYARISADKTGEQAGVTRQLEDCRNLAATLDWTVVEEYVDNDISATSGKVRPRYRDMLAAIEAGEVDAIVVWHTDRLYRKLTDLEPLIEVCERAGVTIKTVRAGDFDVSTPTGRLLARILASVATAEGETKSDRWRRSIRQRRENGQAPGWGPRLFGYARTGEIIEAEADAIRWAADEIIGGRSLGSTVRALNDLGFLTTKGNLWRVAALRSLLENPRLAGHSTLNGDVVGVGTWEPILTDEQHTHLASAFAVRKGSQAPKVRVSLLVGLIRCGGTLGEQPCGSRLITGRNHAGARIYRCKSTPRAPGCNGVQVLAEPLEEMIEAYAQERLADPRVQQRLDLLRATSGENTAEILTLENRLRELETELGDPGIPIEAVKRAISRTRDRIETLRATAVNVAVPQATDWPEELGRRARLVRLVVESVTVSPAIVPGRHVFDDNRVEIEPR